MNITTFGVCIRNIWRLAITLNYINILLPVYFSVFLHGYLIQCIYIVFGVFSYMCLLKNESNTK